MPETGVFRRTRTLCHVITRSLRNLSGKGKKKNRSSAKNCGHGSKPLAELPIAQLRVSGDHTASAASSILGKKLGGAPDGILVQPLERMDHGMSKDTLLELTQSMIMASGLLALALRAKAVGLISTESLLNHRHTLVPTMDRDSDLDEALSTQLSLILGTAPELFAFYFLLFTLTLSSTDEPRN